MNDSIKSGRGGYRPGSGRKSGSGAYSEPTKPIRVPLSQVGKVLGYLSSCRNGGLDAPGRTIPVMSHSIPAGFPSPAEDHVEERVDLNEHLILHRDASFILRVSGWSMVGAGIFDGDEIIVDRAIEPGDGHVVVAVVDGELTVKRLRKSGKAIRLAAENPEYPDIEVNDGEELVIWGVVTRVLHKV